MKVWLEQEGTSKTIISSPLVNQQGNKDSMNSDSQPSSMRVGSTAKDSLSTSLCAWKHMFSPRWPVFSHVWVWFSVGKRRDIDVFLFMCPWLIHTQHVPRQSHHFLPNLHLLWLHILNNLPSHPKQKIWDSPTFSEMYWSCNCKSKKTNWHWLD